MQHDKLDYYNTAGTSKNTACKRSRKIEKKTKKQNKTIV